MCLYCYYYSFIIITIIIIIITTNYCIVLFVLSMLILLIVGFTYPPTVHFRFITKVLLQIARACLLQNATSGITMCDSFIIKKSATEHGSQRCCNINCILNICRQYYSS